MPQFPNLQNGGDICPEAGWGPVIPKDPSSPGLGPGILEATSLKGLRLLPFPGWAAPTPAGLATCFFLS